MFVNNTSKFENEMKELSLERDFFVISKKNGQLKLEHMFYVFSHFSKIFIKDKIVSKKMKKIFLIFHSNPKYGLKRFKALFIEIFYLIKIEKTHDTSFAMRIQKMTMIIMHSIHLHLIIF